MSNISLSNQCVLVTGGGGFIGSHLVDQFVKRNEVRVLDNFTTGSRENVHQSAEVIEGDVRDSNDLSAAVEGVDIVFHQAAQVSVERSIESPEKSFRSNTIPILTLLELAREHDFRVVFASSCAIYGDPQTIPIAEEHRLTPESPYGVEKLTGDYYTRIYHELYDVETVALRYFNVYGPRQSGGDYSGVIGIFKSQAEEGRPITIEGDGGQTRDFVHVSDIVQANCRAAVTENLGEAFNVGTGSSTTISQLAEMIQEISSSSAEIVHTKERSGDIEHSEASIKKIQQQMGFQPMIKLKKGLKKFIK